jgi:hypothetical protein
MKRSFLFFLIFTLVAAVSCKSFRNSKNSVDTKNGYYLNSVSGTDLNPGTMEKPIKSIAELNLRLRQRPADINLASGQEFAGPLELNNIEGPETHPLKIYSWGDGKAVINGNDSEAIKIGDCKNIWINGIDIKGNGRLNGNKTNGLSITNSISCMIENITASGFQKSGVDLYNCKTIVIKNVTATDNGFSGINVMGSARNLSGKIMIQNCKAENNPGDPTNLDNHSGNGILVGVSDDVTIDHCSATNNGWDMPREGNGPVGIWAWESNNVTIQYCISYRNKTSENAKDGGGFDLDGGVTNSLIQYCLSYENQGAGYGLFQYAGASPWRNNVVRYCVSINDGQTTEGSGSFFIWNGSNDAEQLMDCMIYNNVAYNSSGPLISFENSSLHRNFIFCNNIFLGSVNPITGINSGSMFLGNNWWNENSQTTFMSFSNLEEWAKESGQEMYRNRMVGNQQDPKFKGPLLTDITDPYQLEKLYGYTLLPESGLKNKGLDLESVLHVKQPIRDFYGSPVPLGMGSEPGIYEMK